jgi:hypothetical protein
VKAVERSFRLEAPEGLGKKPRPELIGPVLARLHATLRDSVRMGFLHSSRARGRIPEALKRAAEVRYVGHRADEDQSTVLRFEAVPFGSAAPELFGQRLLWEEGPSEDQTAFELFAASLVDVAAQRRESSRFDLGLLQRIGKYGKIVSAKGGLRRIALPDVQTSTSAHIDAAVVQAAKELAAATPRSRRVRVVGRLDLLGVSQRVMKLVLDRQTVVTAVWSSEKEFTDLKDFLDRDVVIEGPAVFRPSGTLLRVDADAIASSTSADEFFRKVPEPILERDYAKLARPRPGEKPGFAQILGIIPAEESDEEFERALEELS